MSRLDLPPVWTVSSWALAWGVSYVVPQPGWDSLGLRWLGLLWILIGVLIVLWSASWFRRKSTPIHPGHTPSDLITEGPFRFSRNPIYLAMVIVTIGVVLWLGSALALVIPVALWVVLDRRFAGPEEARLRTTFGPAADAYIERTGRWI